MGQQISRSERGWKGMAMRKLALLIACGFALGAGLTENLCGQNGDAVAIREKLASQFKLTRVSADRSDVVTAGAMVALQKAGLMMYGVAFPVPPSNTYKNGKIGQGWGGFGSDLGGSLLAPGGQTAKDYPQRRFAPDEKCWVTGIAVQKDSVVFQLYSEPYDQIRYYASLKIPFPNKKEIPSSDQVMQLVGEVLTVVPQEAAGSQPIQAEAANQPAPTDNAPPPQPAPLAPLTPPPPPVDAAPPSPKTIAVGNTKEQVAAILGPPQKVVQLKQKEIDYYPDMKVVFVAGKVSDVQ